MRAEDTNYSTAARGCLPLIKFIYIRIDINSQGNIILLYQLYLFIFDLAFENDGLAIWLTDGYLDDSTSTLRFLPPHFDCPPGCLHRCIGILRNPIRC